MTTLKELKEMDDDEMKLGYQSAQDGYVPRGHETKSFIHGWRNGMVDFGGMPATEDQVRLAKEYLADQRNRSSD